MIPHHKLDAIVRGIHAERELYGCIVGLHGNNQSRVLSGGYMATMNYSRVMVIVEEARGGGIRINRQNLPAQPARAEPIVLRSPTFVANSSRMSQELIGAGISCSLAVVSGLGVLGGVAAELPSGGFSTLLVWANAIGFAASGIQCVNGIVRSFVAMSPDNAGSNSLQQWDDNGIYSWTILIVDAVGVLTGLASLPFAMRNLLAVLERRGGLITAENLGRVPRSERMTAVQNALRQATRTRDGQEAVTRALREAGLTERQVARALAHGASNAQRAGTITQVISEETARRLSGSLRDITGVVAGVGASATPGAWTGSASGSINALIVHVMNRPNG